MGSFGNSENCADAYYHIKISEMGPAVFGADSFQWVKMSVWSDHFSDKEYLFHTILYLLSIVKKALGLGEGHPAFNFYSLPFIAVFMSVYIIAAIKLKAQGPILLSLACFFSTPTFLNRMMMMRPHMLSIILMTGMIILLYYGFSGSLKRRIFLPLVFVLSFIYGLAYSNPHFIIATTLAFCLAAYIKDSQRTVFLPLLLSAGGVLAALVLHPQFPSTFINWKIQCIDVMLHTLSRESHIQTGLELHRPGWKWICINGLVFLTAIYNIVLYALLVKKAGFQKLSIEGTALLIMTVMWLGASFIVMRSIEYLSPVTFLCTGVLIRDKRLADIKLTKSIFADNMKMLLFSVTGLASVLSIWINIDRPTNRVYAPEKLALWMKHANIESGTLIANVNWSDFPVLFHTMPQYRYISGLDPVFSWKKNPEGMEKIEQFRRGLITMTPEELGRITGASYAYARNSDLFRKNGFTVLYDGKDGALVKLPSLAKKLEQSTDSKSN